MDILYSWKVMYLQFTYDDPTIDNNHPTIATENHAIFETKKAKVFEAGWMACQNCAADFFSH